MNRRADTASHGRAGSRYFSTAVRRSDGRETALSTMKDYIRNPQTADGASRNCAIKVTRNLAARLGRRQERSCVSELSLIAWSDLFLSLSLFFSLYTKRGRLVKAAAEQSRSLRRSERRERKFNEARQQRARARAIPMA